MSVERAQHLLETLGHIEKWRAKPASIRKRRFTRFGVRGSAILTSPAGCEHEQSTTSVTIQLRDVGRGGTGFLSDRPLRVDSPWRLTLLDEELVTHSIPFFVRYCQHVEEGAYLVGGEFGIEACVLLALGVSGRNITAHDVPEDSLHQSVSGEFENPDELAEAS
ncbi:MAG: hypothetical protein KAS72_08450 [Phycisphaerales bacterium]|nr:hypothetical protein [Phycisphaerales bacterium]